MSEALDSPISIAIPFYNSAKFLEECIRIPLNHRRVSEIVIADDHSGLSDYQAIIKLVRRAARDASLIACGQKVLRRNFSWGYEDVSIHTYRDQDNRCIEVVLSRNTSNLGGFKNKFKAVALATNPWVFLLDSDNYFLPTSLDAIFNLIPWQRNQCYSPGIVERIFEEPDKNLTIAKKTQLGLPILAHHRDLDLGFFSRLARVPSRYVRFQMDYFLNAGNFFVNRQEYLEVAEPHFRDPEFSPQAADAAAFAASWLISGRKFFIIPGLGYRHLVRNGSYWATSPSPAYASGLREKISRINVRSQRSIVNELLYFSLFFMGLPSLVSWKFSKGTKYFERFVRQFVRKTSKTEAS